MNKVERIKQETIDSITLVAIQNGWSLDRFDKNTGMISFVRPGKERINIFLTTGTVATAINHPTKGKNQLYRRGLSLKEIYILLANPRQHTGKGYRKRDEIIFH